MPFTSALASTLTTLTMLSAVGLAVGHLPSDTTLAPTCREALDSLDARVRENYAGFLLEVRGARRVAYGAMVARERALAAHTPYDACFDRLNRYIEWYADPHLFVFQSPRLDETERERRRLSLRRVALDAANAKAYFARVGSALDPVEGIWFDGALEIAVIRDSSAGRRAFIGVVLKPDTVAWPIGAVRARFTKQDDGSYRVLLDAADFGTRVLTAQLYKRVMLRFSPGIWGKRYPVSAADTGAIDSVDVHAPRLSTRARSVVLSIPSHDPSFAPRLDSLMAANGDAIRQRGLLVVDLRGNEGGASWVTRALDPWVATDTKRPTPFDSGRAVMLSSPAQIAYAKRFTGTDTSAFVRSLVARLEAHPRELVPLEETPTSDEADSSLAGNWRVVMMVDGGTVSAPEVLVLQGLRSTRTTVVGEPTGGALDYQSVQIVSLRTGDPRWALGYPTITAHADLPRRGMRGRGIQPQVRLDWSRMADPFGEIERRFAPR